MSRVDHLVAVGELTEPRGTRRGRRRRLKAGGVDCAVTEYAQLDDGGRVLLRADRGFTVGGFTLGVVAGRDSLFRRKFNKAVDFWQNLDQARVRIKEDIEGVVQPDEVLDPGFVPTLESQWAHAVEALARHGVEETAQRLAGLERVIEFGPRLKARLDGVTEPTASAGA